MDYSELFSDIFICVWNVAFGIARGVVRFFTPVKHKNVSGWRVLVTGGGNGLGRLLCVQFARLGCELVAWDIDEDGLRRTQDEVEYLGAKIHIYTCDLSKRDDVIKTASRVRHDVGDVDILINNAGTVVGKTLVNHSPDDVTRIFNVNVLSQFWTVESFLPAMMARNRGHIVSISSVAAFFGVNRMGSYCSTKFAVNGYMESLRCELLSAGQSGVHTTTVCPYFMNTDLFKGCTVKYPGVFPCLDPDLVARRTVQAILTNQIILCIPRTFYLLAVAKSLLPVESMSAIMTTIGADQLMDGYKGRIGSGLTELTPDSPAETTENRTESPDNVPEIPGVLMNGTANGLSRNGVRSRIESKLLNGNREHESSVERIKSAEA